jgi:hypothetical protein
MKKDYTDITILLDKSGSMAGLTDETIIGFNTYVEDQKKEPGECRITLIQFATTAVITYTAADVKSLSKLNRETYRADGSSTALIDSFVYAIDTTGERLAALPESERPEKVIFLTLTDGIENASRKHTKAQLKEKITHQTNNYNWQFIYQGANQDAIAEAANYGIAMNKAMTFGANDAGMLANYCSASSLTSSLRRSAAASLSSVGYTEEDREENEKHVAAGAK